MSDRFGDSGVDRRLVIDVEGERQDEVAVGIDQRLKRFDIPGCRYDPVASRQGSLGPDASEAFRRSRDEPNFARHNDRSDVRLGSLADLGGVERDAPPRLK
jgi:hypothetical protein